MNDEEKCRLQNYCGRFYDANNVAQCWCYTCDGSRRRVKELKEDVQRWENYVAALEDVCTPEQLRAARKSVGTSRADHIGDSNEMIQREKEAQP